MGVVAGATRAFGRRTQGVWGAGPPTAGGELSGHEALKPPQINIDLTKSLKYVSFVLPACYVNRPSIPNEVSELFD